MKRLAKVFLLFGVWGCAAPASLETESIQAALALDDTNVAEASPPGGVSINGNVPMLTYTGGDRRINLLTPSDPGRTWNKTVLSEWTQPQGAASMHVGPDGLIYMAWAGSDFRVNVHRSATGDSWGDKATLGQPIYVGQPSLVVFRGLLRIYVASATNPPVHATVVHRWTLENGSWHGPEAITPPISTFYGLSVARLGEDVVLGFQNGSIYRSYRYDAGTDRLISGEGQLGGGKSGTLFTAQTSSQSVILVQRGQDDHVNAFQTFDGLGWQEFARPSEWTSASPYGFLADDSSLTFAHVGTDPGRTLNFNTVAR